MILGIFSIFGAYMIAGVIWNNDVFKFLVTFVLSTSQGALTKTTWTGNARTLFIIALPIFIYVLLRTQSIKLRFSLLSCIIFGLLCVTHHYIYFVIFILFSYFIIVVLYTLKNYIKSVKISENFTNFAMLTTLLFMFVFSYFHRTLYWSDPGFSRTISAGSSSFYFWVINIMLVQYVRYIGILIIFIFSGYVYLTFKENKKFEEWVLLMCIVSIVPLLFMPTYAKWFVLPFASLLIGLALTNLALAKKDIKKCKTTFLIIVLLSSVIFTGYYQYLHFLNDPDPFERYMEERTYIGGLWIRDNIDKNKNMIGESNIGTRVFSTSGIPTLTGVGAADLAYDFVDPSKFEVEKLGSYTSVETYIGDPYVLVNSRPTDWVVLHILDSDINDKSGWAYQLIPEFNLSYFAENKDISNTLSRSVQQTTDCIYDNGKIRVWDLDTSLE
jgi:hypothetical protein